MWWWGSVLAAIRVGALWLLVSRLWTNQQSLTSLPLVLLLFPEALLLPGSVTWTAKLAVVFSVVLIAGSFLCVTVAALAVRAARAPR